MILREYEAGFRMAVIAGDFRCMRDAQRSGPTEITIHFIAARFDFARHDQSILLTSDIRVPILGDTSAGSFDLVAASISPHRPCGFASRAPFKII